MNNEIQYFDPPELIFSSMRHLADRLDVGDEVRVMDIPRDKRESFYTQAHTNVFIHPLLEDRFEENFGLGSYSLRRLI